MADGAAPAPAADAPPRAAPGEYAPPGAAGAAVERPAAGALAVPRDTTPTWEIELLVSGAVLFGLFQIPPALYALWDRWEPNLASFGRVAGGSALLIATTAVYALVGCFVAHLVLRAYWVALVGAHSVFPGGVRWERQREYGPVQARLAERAVRPLPEFIARADNLASLVFAGGFVCAASVLSATVVLGAGLALIGAAMQLFPERPAMYAGFGVLAVAALAMVGAGVIDFRYGARIAPDGRAGRALALVLRVGTGALPAGVRSLTSVLTSNIPKRVAYGALALGVGGAYAVGIANMPTRGDGDARASGFRYFDDASDTRGVRASRYESLRRPDDDVTGPSIQSDVVRDPYLRLFIPYRASRHDAAFARACPGLRSPADVEPESPAAAAVADAILACAARVHRPALDGRPITAASFRFHVNPATSRRGFLMLVPLDGVAAGEHRLTVWPVPAPGRAPPAAPVTIPFWR